MRHSAPEQVVAVEVCRQVRRAVWQARTTTLLGFRDSGAINDRPQQELQLELEREHVELGASGPEASATMRG